MVKRHDGFRRNHLPLLPTRHTADRSTLQTIDTLHDSGNAFPRLGVDHLLLELLLPPIRFRRGRAVNAASFHVHKTLRHPDTAVVANDAAHIAVEIHEVLFQLLDQHGGHGHEHAIRQLGMTYSRESNLSILRRTRVQRSGATGIHVLDLGLHVKHHPNELHSPGLLPRKGTASAAHLRRFFDDAHHPEEERC